jgi:hypothetical protein
VAIICLGSKLTSYLKQALAKTNNAWGMVGYKGAVLAVYQLHPRLEHVAVLASLVVA